jgi:hypothetical protein
MRTFTFRVVAVGLFLGAVGLIALGYFTLKPVSLTDRSEKKIVSRVVEPEPEEDPFFGASGFSPEDVDSMAPPEETEGEVPEKHQVLIAELEKLIADTIYMKVGSRGTRVGTVQKFLNLYLDKDLTVDNDYGNGTKSRVAAFQKTEGLSADGQAGPVTYKAMIDWLETP